MLKFVLPAVAAFAVALVAGPAEAHQRHIKIWKPYVIEKYCADEDFGHCKVRMDYAPFQHATLSGSGSYWYQWPHRYRHYHRHHHHSASRHVRWCLDRYRTYDPHTDMFVGKGHRHYRCNSPYDGM